MKPVEQTTFYDGTGARGNCVAACVASVFGLPLWVVETQGVGPGAGGQDLMRWTTERWPALECRVFDFAVNSRIVEGEGTEDERWAYDLPEDVPAPPTTGFWIAYVISPRGLLEHGPYRGMPIQHAVVMRGGSLAWDPHPQRDMGIGQEVGRCYWTVSDPSELLSWRFCWGMYGSPSIDDIDHALKTEMALDV